MALRHPPVLADCVSGEMSAAEGTNKRVAPVDDGIDATTALLVVPRNKSQEAAADG